MRVPQVRCNQRIVLKHSLDFRDRNPTLLALCAVPAVPIESVVLKDIVSGIYANVYTNVNRI